MPGLTDAGLVLDRVGRNAGLTIPSTLDETKVQEYVDVAEATVLRKAGLDSPPAPNTQERRVLSDAATRLAVLAILGDLQSTEPEAREANRRERDSLLKEIAELAADDADDGGLGEAWLDVADTPMGDEDT